MKILIPVQYDSANSYTDSLDLGVKFNLNDQYIELVIEHPDRTITVKRSELIAILKFLE